MIDRVELSSPIHSVVDCALNRVINATHNPDVVYESAVAQELSGRIFETIAHETIKARQPDYRTLMSPHETLRFFQKLHPTSKTMYDSFGPTGIRGITVPDGLLYDTRWEEEHNNGLCRLYEYTLVRPTRFLDYVHHKEDAFRIMRQKFDTLFSNAEMVFVIPAVYGLELPIKFRGNSRIETVNVSPHEIREACSQYVQNVSSML